MSCNELDEWMNGFQSTAVPTLTSAPAQRRFSACGGEGVLVPFCRIVRDKWRYTVG